MRRVLKRPTLAVLAAAAVATSTLVGGSVALGAAPGANVTFTGTASNLDAYTLTTDSTGEKVDFRWNLYGLDGCTGSASMTGIPVRTNPDGFTATRVYENPAGYVKGWVGYFGDGGAVAGAHGSDYPSGPGNCISNRVTYTARAAGSDSQQGPGLTALGIYNGDVVSLMPPAGIRGGTIELTADASGKAISRIAIAYSEGSCSYPVSLTDISITDGKMFHVGTRSTVAQAKVPSVAGVTQTAQRVSGAFSHPGSSGCAAVAGRWTATLTSTATVTPTTPATTTTTPAATATAAAAAGSGKVSGNIPVAGGIGLVVFSGGTSAQLVTASGCPSATAAFWSDDGAGGFITYVPGTSIDVVNAAWMAKFASGIPANTPLIGRCQ